MSDAVLGTNLVDSLVVDVIDGLRNDLHPAFGVRAFRVFTVARAWDSGYIGDGVYLDVETELLPQPLVESYTSTMFGKLEPCGFDEAGYIILKEISLTNTEADLTGGTLAPGVEWFIRLKEAHGQATETRDFVVDRPPYPDRIKNMGWELRLRVSGGA